MEYKGLTLDQFQIDAINYIEKGNSVVVSAATGTGKTLIADYLIDKFLKEHKRVIYTSPIKALSNQKYKEFKTAFGEEMVGLLTGDVTINHNAQILIMTTEIYRNMLVTKDELVDQLSYIVFDEIHYINDIERGTVWEEAIIFSPEHVRFLCLSATIPNAKEFADWIQTIKGHEVSVVKYDKRAVPLTHKLYDSMLGLTTIKELRPALELDKYPDYYKALKLKKNHHDKHDKHDKRRQQVPMPYHADLVDELSEKDKLPGLFFVFSRRRCEELADDLARKHDFTNAAQKEKIINQFLYTVPKDLRRMESVQFMRRILPKGIAVHHAGLLPVLKEVVEELFGQGLISVLYATETFAVGINMPARTVCFHALEKFDGMNFRFLNSKEYFQLAGRAGRRGIDKEGLAIALVDRKTFDVNKVEAFTSKDTDPIISQFKLSYNTVINLVDKHTKEEQEIILKSSFDYYLKKKGGQQIRIMATYNHMIERLKKLGYVSKDDKVTEKGRFATHIYSNELLITEIFCGDLYKKLSDTEIAVLVAAIIYEEKLSDKFKIGDKKTYYNIIDTLAVNEFVTKKINQKSISKMNNLVSAWCNGADFHDLMDMTSLDEGDIIRVFRQIIDLYRQIVRASTDRQLIERLEKSIVNIQRDVIKVEF